MSEKSLWLVMMFASISLMSGCASKGKYITTNLNKQDMELTRSGKLVKIQQVLPQNTDEKLMLTSNAYPNGVIVCAIENMSSPCLPKLSALIAGKLTKKGVVIASDQSKADAIVYFETLFDTYSSYSSMVKGLMSNPASMGSGFAVKMEQSLASGQDPDVHKHFRFSFDPSINANDEQKFIYMALRAVPLKDSVSYPGSDNIKYSDSLNSWVISKGASINPWVKDGVLPSSRSLVGNYDGVVETSKAVTPIFNDAVGLLVDRVMHDPVIVPH